MPTPPLDPTPIFEHYRGAYGSELLTAAIAHLGVFTALADGPRPPAALAATLGLARRPFLVLTTALKAMGLLVESAGAIGLTDLARHHLVPGGAFDVGGYVGLGASSPSVLAMVDRLRADRPTVEEAAFLYREGIDTAMEREASARSLTLALAGRARNVAPWLARNYPHDDATTLLDVGGGTGIYSIAYLRACPGLRAIVWDRPEVLKVAREMGEEFGVLDRLELRPGDMFADPVPSADVVLVSNILHDWDEPECAALVRRFAEALPAGGRLLIHDVFLNDDLDGPLPIALYSAALFAITEGRAYSATEYRSWLVDAGLVPGPVVPTLVHCGVLPGRRR